MEINWEKPISSSRDHQRHPSFSSTLLDQIYRSIDDSPAVNSSFTKKQLHRSLHDHHQISTDYHRHSIAADFDRSRKTTTDSVFLRYSNSSSSDSNGFSSSESGRSKSSASPPPPYLQPKPIRTSVEHSGVQKPNSKQELGGFLRTKSKALKIYTDLKKIKQPISPGGRLATFLNSLFTSSTTNTKKQKIKTSTTVAEPPSSNCSSASSYSRSCLSKTPSSTGKSKRSVRFCPVNIILDEESSTIPMPYNYCYNNNDAKRHRHVMEEENRRIIEAAKDLIRTYQKNKDHHHLPVTKTNNVEEEDEDDDAASYASSDLFELENLSAIGIERYQEELPVYETTRMDTNRAIATRLIV